MIECKIEEPALDITPELARQAVHVVSSYLDKDLLELPARAGNSIVYRRSDGELVIKTCGNKAEAERMLMEMKEGMG